MSSIIQELNAHENALNHLNMHDQQMHVYIARLEERVAVLESAAAHLLIRVALKEEEAERQAERSTATVVTPSPSPVPTPTPSVHRRWSLVGHMGPTADRLKRALSRATIKARVKMAMGEGL
jgi:septal ring factor EnvC (AmiA/AmiB activator)